MKTGFRGTFVISWSQTEIDGLDLAPLHALTVGAAWLWKGEPVQVDGPNDVLRLDRTDAAKNLRRRAAHMVTRLVGAALERDTPLLGDPERDVRRDPLMDRCFVVTDGAQSYTVTLIDVPGRANPLLMFLNEIPPANRELWVVYHTLDTGPGDSTSESSGGVICFTPGTHIRTPVGPRMIEDLRPGDLIDTMDSGPQEIQWIGSRLMTGARLFAMPRLRPVRISSHVFGDDRPDRELLVSPEHRVLIRGDAARDLFNTPEVLVSAKDLVDGDTVRVDRQIREVTYIHILMEQHQVVWANGVETESFHPASAALSTLSGQDRSRLLAAYPELELDPHTYGDFARRNLSQSEAVLLMHAA
ncbi:Hint domain-containing protein [Sulfitobacter aestuariivivens]|uniref:Hint domain-containing protein n=1 Tax=Sulfitobacter aestuariivivens TaxID=2766981 RepID=A0A927D5V7_9RHOB|nr:Hint domain-containing protein [Sulfitobacter aestuariivivens]MBD3664037.1 Hint domain-containing protein [Sulfitobacter aestuariivivens]